VQPFDERSHHGQASRHRIRFRRRSVRGSGRLRELRARGLDLRVRPRRRREQIQARRADGLRVTYEGFAAAWPSREGEFADKLNADPKYVVSNTLESPEWQNTTVISGDVVGGLKRLKDETEGTILVHGSGTLVRTLLENDLVDELRLMVFPTILGRGKRVFPDGIDRLKFNLTESRTVGPDGVHVQVYERAS
jgi:dihydrofolate reductase